ncbi:MAG: M50 family metallopeptidase [Bacteroidota bacterium]
MKRLDKKKKQYLELISLATIIIITILFWETFLIYPIKLFVVTLHEISHGIAAILSGGTVESLDIGLNLGGVCISGGGDQIFIASSGYLGSFLFGSAIFYSAYNYKLGKWILLSTALILFIFLVNTSANTTFILVSILLIAILTLVNYFLPKLVFNYLVKSIGLISCIYVIVDIKEDLLSESVITSDAVIIENLTGINSYLIALIWLVISLIGIAFLIRQGLKKGINY